MKIIFLNTWNGKMGDEMTEFLKKEALDADIFCLQEVFSEMESIAEKYLTNYRETKAFKLVTDRTDIFSQATYVKKEINVISSEIVFDKESTHGLGIYTHFKYNNQNIHLINFHGLSRPVDKLDNPNRLQCSKDLISFLSQKNGVKIIGGDFNLLPETESIQMFESNGYRDLIKDYKIETTRNRLGWERYPNNKQYYSDYIFLSPETKLKNFAVIQNEISDHLPLILEIE